MESESSGPIQHQVFQVLRSIIIDIHISIHTHIYIYIIYLQDLGEPSKAAVLKMVD